MSTNEKGTARWRIERAATFPIGAPDFATDLGVTIGNYLLAEADHAQDNQDVEAFMEKMAWRSRLRILLRMPESER